jgi:peptidoglycan/LPS O-acetylase OafA/YrhL
MTEPTRRDRTRPVELIGLSAVVAIGVGFVTYFSTKNLVLAAEFGGVTFIVALVVFAMLLLAVSPRRGDRDPGDDDDHGH